MDLSNNFLESCLFFNTNALARNLLKLAEDEFKHLNLSPAHASLLLIVYDLPGIGPKALAEHLNLTPSTITRFVDALAKKGLVKRKSKGKASMISATRKGLNLKPAVAVSYKKFFLKYNQLLGEKKAASLSYALFNANKALAGSVDE